MRPTNALMALIGLTVPAALGNRISEAESILLDLNSQAIESLESSQGLESRADGKCSIFSASVRRDWAALSKAERRDYLGAVKCLFNSPSKLRELDPTIAPGAVSRYDDFVAVHINQTLTIHGTGNFLTWHRYFVWAYETALRDECGYKGYQPYWNWFSHTEDPSKSPVWDGSDTSLGGTGAFVDHNGHTAALGAVHVPPGGGGGCLTNGPFADVQINLGPVRPNMDTLVPSPTGPLGPNPRCIRRDLSSWVFTRWFTAANLLNVTVGSASHSIASMQAEFQGRFGDGFVGLHTAGHLGVGAEAGDVFSSPNDPSFFLHHAMVDRIYWIWQVLHPFSAGDIAGTITINNNPPSRDALKTDLLDLGIHALSRPISQLLSTLGGSPLCYVYL